MLRKSFFKQEECVFCLVFVCLHAGKHILKISKAKITLKNNDSDSIMLLYIDLLLC